MLFVAPTRALVERQLEACDLYKSAMEDVAVIVDCTTSADRAELWRSRRVIYTTEQVRPVVFV